MINSFSVASSHSAAGAGAGAAAAITLHFNYNNNSNSNNNKNKSSKSNIINNNAKIVPAPATKEHKNHNIINPSAPTTTTTTAKMFKITQSEVVEAKHFLMTYPQQHHHQQQQQQQQKQQQQRAGGSLKWMSPGKIITSASTKEPQLIQVNIQSNSSNNNHSTNNKKQQLQLKATTTTTTSAIAKSAFIEAWTMPQQTQQQQKQRTEDQENAFRQIEDVHNYAKLQHQRHHQQQQIQQLQHSGSSEDEELGEDDDDEDEELLDGDLEEEEEYEEEKLVQAQRKLELKHKKNQRNVNSNINEDSEEHVEVDVVTVTPTTPTAAVITAPQQQQELQEEEPHATSTIIQDHMRPEHHARRPMNAFLIFCKRHRAIVKERYKSLENRAITKILGDWWAALDEQEKLCFTELAQLNKDAFFNANPNFKWYKLPAPPLRTLATRPSNAAAAHLSEELQQTQQQQHQQLLMQHQQQLQWVPNKVAHLLPRPFFKFADETQMGELSVLLSANASNVPDKDYALQQALSETTQFLSAHMPNNGSSNNSNKRPVDSASNSSEEEERGSPNKKIKSTRSCKGKIYQELINSGQLAAIAKKSKCRLNSGGSGGSAGSGTNTDANSNTPPISPVAASAGIAQLSTELESSTRARPMANRRSNCEGLEFDLEEKIKELPALSLDAYLQRKRSTKKKKKFTSSKKQRNSNSSSSAVPATATVAAPSTPIAVAVATAGSKSTRRNKLDQLLPAAIAVGSQKRKARKESITRRDVSAIEQEVASILPLTINGCYYFNQTRPLAATAAAGTGAPTVGDAMCLQPQIVNTSPLSSSSSTLSGCERAPFDVTSTSDLLILAEVAANRTELSKSN